MKRTLRTLRILCFCFLLYKCTSQLSDVSSLDATVASQGLAYRSIRKIGPRQAHPRSLIWAFTVRYQSHWILQNILVCMESKNPDDSLRMRRIIRMRILRMLEGTFPSLDAVHFQLPERSSIARKCCKCGSINCDTFTFQNFELQTSNAIYPLTFGSTIESFHSPVLSPLHTSSPKISKSQQRVSRCPTID